MDSFVPHGAVAQIGDLHFSQCRHGWMLHSGPYIGRCFQMYGEYSESEVEVFRTYLKSGQVALDVGANIGDLTVPMAKIVGSEGRVFAFESHPKVFNVLCANLALNDLAHVRPINAFVASSADVDTGSTGWGKYAYTGEIWPASFVSIDALHLPRLDFVKVDVDGSELDVLASGVATLRQYKPVIYFENDHQDRSAALIRFVQELGYRVFFHLAPIRRPENYYGNPENPWAPDDFRSLMMLAIPDGSPIPPELREVRSADDWWDASEDTGRAILFAKRIAMRA